MCSGLLVKRLDTISIRAEAMQNPMVGICGVCGVCAGLLGRSPLYLFSGTLVGEKQYQQSTGKQGLV